MHHVTLRSRLRSRMTRRSKPKKASGEMKFPKNFRYWPLLVVVSSIMLLLVTFRMAPKSSSAANILGAYGDTPNMGGNSFKSPQSPDDMMARRLDHRKMSDSSGIDPNDRDYDESEKGRPGDNPFQGVEGGRPPYRSRNRRKALARLRPKSEASVEVTTQVQPEKPATPPVPKILPNSEVGPAVEQNNEKPEETTIYDLEESTTAAPFPNYDHMGMFPVYPFF